MRVYGSAGSSPMIREETETKTSDFGAGDANSRLLDVLGHGTGRNDTTRLEMVADHGGSSAAEALDECLETLAPSGASATVVAPLVARRRAAKQLLELLDDERVRFRLRAHGVGRTLIRVLSQHVRSAGDGVPDRYISRALVAGLLRLLREDPTTAEGLTRGSISALLRLVRCREGWVTDSGAELGDVEEEVVVKRRKSRLEELRARASARSGGAVGNNRAKRARSEVAGVDGDGFGGSLDVREEVGEVGEEWGVDGCEIPCDCLALELLRVACAEGSDEVAEKEAVAVQAALRGVEGSEDGSRLSRAVCSLKEFFSEASGSMVTVVSCVVEGCAALDAGKGEGVVMLRVMLALQALESVLFACKGAQEKAADLRVSKEVWRRAAKLHGGEVPEGDAWTVVEVVNGILARSGSIPALENAAMRVLLNLTNHHTELAEMLTTSRRTGPAPCIVSAGGRAVPFAGDSGLCGVVSIALAHRGAVPELAHALPAPPSGGESDTLARLVLALGVLINVLESDSEAATALTQIRVPAHAILTENASVIRILALGFAACAQGLRPFLQASGLYSKKDEEEAKPPKSILSGDLLAGDESSSKPSQNMFSGDLLGSSSKPPKSIPSGDLLGSSSKPPKSIPSGDLLGSSSKPPKNTLSGDSDDASSNPWERSTLVVAAHLALVLGLAALESRVVEDQVREVLPREEHETHTGAGSLLPLVAVLRAFVRAQTEAGLITADSLAHIAHVVHALADLDRGQRQAPASPDRVSTPKRTRTYTPGGSRSSTPRRTIDFLQGTPPKPSSSTSPSTPSRKKSRALLKQRILKEDQQPKLPEHLLRNAINEATSPSKQSPEKSSTKSSNASATKKSSSPARRALAKPPPIQRTPTSSSKSSSQPSSKTYGRVSSQKRSDAGKTLDLMGIDRPSALGGFRVPRRSNDTEPADDFEFDDEDIEPQQPTKLNPIVPKRTTKSKKLAEHPPAASDFEFDEF